MNYATSSFFDDIRIEANHKRLLIGGYTSSISASSLPINLPNLWVCIQYGTPITNIDAPVLVEVKIPGKSEPHTTNLNSTPQTPPKDVGDAKHLIIRMDIPLGALRLSEEGKIEVVVVTASGERVRAGKISIVDQSKNGVDSFPLTMNSLPILMAKYQKLKEQKSTTDAIDFASVALDSICQYMRKEHVDAILENFDDKLAIDNDRAIVFFPTPLNSIPPNVKIISPVSEDKYKVVRLSRFGFELHYQEPQENTPDFEYELIMK